MTAKLTLSIDEGVIRAAKEYAQREGRSVSSIVENYFRALSAEKKSPELPPKLRRLMGIIKVPDDFDYKKEMTNILSEKYGL